MKFNFQIFDQNHGLTALEKCHFCDFHKIDVLKVQRGLFSIQNGTKHFCIAYFGYKERIERFQIFYQNHWLTPLGKCQLCKSFFFYLWQSCYFSGIETLEFSSIYPSIQPAAAHVFPVVGNTPTKSIQKQIKSKYPEKCSTSLKQEVTKMPLASKSCFVQN